MSIATLIETDRERRIEIDASSQTVNLLVENTATDSIDPAMYVGLFPSEARDLAASLIAYAHNIDGLGQEAHAFSLVKHRRRLIGVCVCGWTDKGQRIAMTTADMLGSSYVEHVNKCHEDYEAWLEAERRPVTP